MGWPVVSEHCPRAPSSPTVLIYGHYDVAPPEPPISGNRPYSSQRYTTASFFVAAFAMTRARDALPLKALESYV
jgi:hypothetical protein